MWFEHVRGCLAPCSQARALAAEPAPCSGRVPEHLLKRVEVARRDDGQCERLLFGQQGVELVRERVEVGRPPDGYGDDRPAGAVQNSPQSSPPQRETLSLIGVT